MALTSVGIAAGIFSLAVGCAMVVIAGKILQRYREKKQRATLYLLLSILGFIGSSWFGTATYFLAPEAIEAARVTNKLIYTCVFLGTIFTYLFASKIFFQPKKWHNALYITIGIACIVLINATESSELQYIGEYPVLLLRIYYSAVLLGFMVPTFLGIFLVALRTSRKVEDPLYQAGYRMIAYAEIQPLLTFVADACASLFMDVPTIYTLFLMLTWIFPGIAAVFYYLGWILPQWFRDRVAGKGQP